jgi:hypothetical protein
MLIFKAKRMLKVLKRIYLIRQFLLLLISYLTRDLNFKLKIRPDIRYPAFRLAGNLAQSLPVSGVPVFPG